MNRLKITISLRMKLFVAFALVALAPLLFLAVVNGRNIRQSLINNANQSLFIVANEAANALDELIDRTANGFAAESRLPVILSYFALPPEARQASAEAMRLQAQLTTLRDNHEFATSYGILNVAGENVLDSNADYQGQSEASRDYFRHFQEAQIGNIPFISDVEYRADEEVARLYFVVPIMDANGEHVGFLRAEYDAAILQSVIAAQNGLAGEGSFGVLFDEHNIHLAHGTEPTFNFIPIVPLSPEVEAELQANGRLRHLPPDQLYPMNLEALNTALNNVADEPFFEAKDAATGTAVNQVAAITLRNKPWVVAFFQPQPIFLAPVEAQIRQTALLVSVIAGTAVLAAYVFGGLLVRPLNALTQTVTSFANGDLLARSHSTSHDEIGLLAANFDAMAERVGILLTGLESRTEALEQEVAERKQTEEKLRQQRRFLRQVMDVNPNFIFAKDRDGRFVIINQTFADIYDTTIENMLGKTDADFNLDPEKVAQFRRDDQQVFATGEELFIPEQRSVNAAGEARWWQTIKRPIHAEDGTISEVLTVVTDITERKETEETLRQARDRVLEASRLKSEILANAHHELQTPLGAILGYAEMIEMGYFGDVSEPQKEVLHKIIGRTNHLTALIQDLLAQANLEARKIGANQTVVLPDEMLRELHQKMDAQAAAKGLTLTSEIAEDFPGLLISDPKRLQKILTNLVGNGIKFTKAGNIHIRFYQPDSTSWAMAVSDTGPGIPEEAQTYIFDPFRQMDGSITRIHQGFGLGLSLVKELTLSLEGEVQLASEVGKGSTFTVILPYMPVMEVVN